MYMLEVRLRNQESEQSCVCLRGIANKPGDSVVMCMCSRYRYENRRVSSHVYVLEVLLQSQESE